VVVICVAAACSGNPAAPPAEDAPDQVFIGVRQMMAADGTARARIEADSAFLFVDRQVMHLFGVKTSLIEPPYSTAVATLEAPHGEVDLRTNTLSVSGGVQAVGEVSGVRIEAESMWVDPRSGLVSTTATAAVPGGVPGRGVERYDFLLRPAATPTE
jgi:hypothetical protein